MLSFRHHVLEKSVPILPCRAPSRVRPNHQRPSERTAERPSRRFRRCRPLLRFRRSDAQAVAFDDDGKPTEEGTYEYWWASPKVYRSTWSRPGASHTNWQTADGKHSYLARGGALNYFEYRLQSALLSPLPGPEDLDPSKFRLDREELKLDGVKFPCIMVIPLMPQHGQVQEVPFGLFPTYCFDPELPALRISYSFGSSAMQFNDLVTVQNRILAREVLFFEGKRRILSAKVSGVEGILPNNPAFTPSADAVAVQTGKAQLASGITTGMLIKKQVPVYPQDAKDARVSG